MSLSDSRPTVRLGNPTQARREWRNGWPVVLTAFVGGATVQAQTTSLAILVKPLGELFGWSRGEVTLALSFSAFSTIVLGPFMGGLVDRIGARNVALAGAPLAALGMILIGLSGPKLMGWYAAWLFYAAVQVANGPTVWASVVTKMFRATRGLALGVALSGAGAGAMIYPRVMVSLLDHFGWRGVYIGLALLNLALLGPLAFFALPRKSQANAPPLLVSSAMAHFESGDVVNGMAVKSAVQTSTFWRLGFLVAVTGAAIASLSVHLQPLMTDHGVDPAAAASIIAVIGPSVIAGRLVGGALLDRIHARWIAMVFLALPATGCLLLIGFHGDHLHALLAAIGVGLASGVEGDMLAVMVSRYFGVRRFGAIYGLTMSLFACGYALAPPAAGMLYDRTGSYDPGLLGLSVALFVAVGVAATFGPYPDRYQLFTIRSRVRSAP
jgi:MFS family permease